MRHYIDKDGINKIDRRRGVDRRQQRDRREDIRFEPEKEDRRSGVERRKSLLNAWNKARTK
jgi:hypothetical protein